MSNKLFRTAVGLEVNGVKLFYGLGTPQSQPQLPLIEGAFYFDGAAGVQWIVENGGWEIRGGGEAKYIVFDNSVAQLPGSPAPQTVQDVIDILSSLIEGANTAAEIPFDNTVAQLLYSPEPTTIQLAIEAVDARQDFIEPVVADHESRIIALEGDVINSNEVIHDAGTSPDTTVADVLNDHEARLIDHELRVVAIENDVVNSNEVIHNAGPSPDITVSDVLTDHEARLLVVESIPPGSATAATTTFDNTNTQLAGSPTPTTVQDALEIIDARIDMLEIAPSAGGILMGLPAEYTLDGTTTFTMSNNNKTASFNTSGFASYSVTSNPVTNVDLSIGKKIIEVQFAPLYTAATFSPGGPATYVSTTAWISCGGITATWGKQSSTTGGPAASSKISSGSLSIDVSDGVTHVAALVFDAIAGTKELIVDNVSVGTEPWTPAIVSLSAAGYSFITSATYPTSGTLVSATLVTNLADMQTTIPSNTTDICGNSYIPPATWLYKNTNFTIQNGGRYHVDTSAGAVYATLPATLDASFEASFKDAKGTWGDVNKEFYIVSGAPFTSPPTYTIAGDTGLTSSPIGLPSLIVDQAYADIHLSFDAINNNVVI